MTKTILMLTIAGASFATAAHATDYKATCSRGADARVIEVIAPGTVGQSCDVRYTRGAGNVSVPYHADSNTAFCDGKAREMAQRLVTAGFSCNGAAPALRADAAPQSDYVVEAKRVEPAVAPSPEPAVVSPAPAPAAPATVAPQQQSVAPQASTDAVAVAAAAETAEDDVDAMMDEILAQPPATQASAGAPAQLVASQAKVEPVAPPPANAGRLVGAAPEAPAPAAVAAAEPKAATPVTQAAVTIEAPKAEAPKTEAPKAPPAAEVKTETKVAQAEAPKAAPPQPAKTTAPATATRGPREIITATLMAQAAAWNEGDLDGFMNGYVKDDNLRFVSGGTVIKGWNAVMKRYRDTYQNGTSLGQLGFDKLDVRLVTDDVAVVTGQFNLAQNGALTTGMFSLVMRRIDGVWRIVHDHTTSGAQ